MESDQLKLLGRSVAPIDAAVADAGTIGLKVFVEEPGAIPSVATILSEAAGKVQKAARGPIFLYLMDPALPGEVEIDTGAEFPVNPEIKGALKSLPGVMAVEEV